MIEWILVADAGRARLYAAPAPGVVNLIESIDNPRGRMKGSELRTDGPGSYSEDGRGPNPTGGMQARTPAEEVEEIRFAKELAQRLSRSLKRGEYERLRLVAPPQFLGRLRQEIDAQVAKHLGESEAKDLTYLSDHDLQQRLRTMLRPGG